jgi:secreted PhoX family phosphatase
LGLATTASAIPRFSFADLTKKLGDGKSQSGKGDPLPKPKYLPIEPSTVDQVRVSPSLSYKILIKEGESIGNGIFGADNDYLAFLPKSKSEGFLWVNHENISPYIGSDYKDGEARTQAQYDFEKKMVGGSFIEIKKNGDWWEVDRKSKANFRLDADSEIPLISDREIRGSKVAKGTFANCAGGVTPWGTVLTCEENYYGFTGEYEYKTGQSNPTKIIPGRMQWEKFEKREPEHHGFVVEIEPKTKTAKKLVALGRFAHESATTVLGKDGRCVVYSGDDAENECLYKFISEKPGSLEKGELFVANLKKGRWESLDFSKSKVLQKKFKDQTEVLLRCREASKLVGGTPLDRPEDVEIDPKTGSVLVALTNNKKRMNFSGSILRISEDGNDYLGLSFKHEVFLTGGEDTGFACPDNMAFDKSGDLWFTSDISDEIVGKFPYIYHGNNSLFYVPMSGPLSGKVFRVATAPIQAEFTGPCFSEDGKTLFLSVQHPGGASVNGKWTSHWPEGGTAKPKSSVIQIKV